MRVAIVINPVSGRRAGASSARDRRALAERAVREAGVTAEIELTRERGHAAHLSASFLARGFDTVVAWGGDGTVNEVAGPLRRTGAALGIVPAGSGDGLAHGLGLPRRTSEAIRVALTGPAGAIDVGLLGDRHFLNIGGIGFDAAVAEAFNLGRARGLLSYVRGVLTGVWSYRPARYELTVDGESETGEFFLVAFANAREYGNRLVLAANADPADGLLEMVVVEPGPAWVQLWRARRLAIGVTRPARGLRRRRVESARVAGLMLACHVDGETFQASGSIEARVEPASLRVRGLAPDLRRGS